MEKEILKDYVDKKMSTYEIANKIGKSQTTVEYWLKKFDLKTNNSSIRNKLVVDYGDEKFCPRCKQKRPVEEFYKRRGKESGSTYCKKCTNKQTTERHQLLKKQCIDYKGGKCQICGYSKCNASIDFHHIDPNEKDFNISDLQSHSFCEKVKKELDKCILVCKNCHGEIHSGLIKI